MATDLPASPTLARAFLAVAILLLPAGLLLFIFADSIATLPAAARASNPWPWPIGPLVLRFVASLILSAALVTYLVSRRADPPTVNAFANVLSIVTGLLLLHTLLNLGAIDWAKPLSYLWLLVLALSLAGGLLLAFRSRRQIPPNVSLPPTPAIARTIAILIFFLTTLVGGSMLLLPEFSREHWPWDLANSTNVQLLGVVFLSVGLSSLLSWLQPSWYGYDLFYPAAGTFATVALLASFMHWDLFAARATTSIIFVAIYILGAIMGFYPYFRYAIAYNKSLTPQPL